MRVSFLSLVLAGCAVSADHVGHPPGIHEEDGSTVQEAIDDDGYATSDDDRYGATTWTWRGSFTKIGIGTGEEGWEGTEETVVSSSDGIACGLLWQTHENNPLSSSLCEDCAAGWSVTCDSGQIAAGDACDQYFEQDYYTSVTTFDMAFRADGPADENGVQTGVVLFRESGMQVMWYEGAIGTFDGTTLTYEVSVEY